ncbi:MAG TPA: hypothetical protein VJ398_07410 [Acidimicrobiia bacterium]|jgi:hypothetical protein|nr:hypothetical protein [Acidimicrobiia bacterium]
MTEPVGGGMKASGRSSGASLMALGALILIGGYLIFELILDEFRTGVLELLLAFWILAVVGMGARASGGMTSKTVLKILGYSLSFIGAYWLLSYIRSGFPDDAVDVIAAIVYFGGIVVVFLGTRGLPQEG